MFTRAGSNPSQFSTSLLSEKDKMRGQNRGVPPALTLLLVLCISAGAFVLGLHLNKKTPVLNVPATGQAIMQLEQAAGHAPVGRHITLDFYNVPKPLSVALEDTNSLQRKVSALIKQAKMTLLGHSCHVFEVQGITCVWLLSESHLSLHTWPEHGYAALDIFTCGTKARPELLAEGMKQMMQPGLVVREEQKRGGLDLQELTPEQRKAKELHTFLASTSEDDADGLEFVFHRVPILRTFRSPYQHIQVVEAHGQLGRCLLLDNKVQFCSHDLDGYTNHMSHEPLKTLHYLRQESCSGSSSRVPKALSGGVAMAAGSAITARGRVGKKRTHSTDLVPHPPFHPAASSDKDNYISCHVSELTQQFGGSCNKDQLKPARVLLIGGGDGWIAGHLIGCYGSLVHSVQAVELDKAVSDVTSAFFFNATGLDPFNHPRIDWEYTDAFGWVRKTAERCHGSIATSRHMLGASSGDCTPYDLVIIDSTDHDEGTSGTLYTEAFYASLYRLMAPRASLIQQFNTYDRFYESSIKSTEASIKRGGWEDVFKSLVYTPAYSGETVFLQAAKRAE